ncbi:N-acyl homoserine lactonase family protein, partial [Rhizobium ruizarguesonis]
NGADYEIPVPFFLITHPDGHNIIDGGNAIEVATDPCGHWGGICDVYWPVLDKEKGCVDQVKALGFDPADVKYVVQS